MPPPIGDLINMVCVYRRALGCRIAQRCCDCELIESRTFADTIRYDHQTATLALDLFPRDNAQLPTIAITHHRCIICKLVGDRACGSGFEFRFAAHFMHVRAVR